MIAIDIKGGKETVKALTRLDPQLRKEFNRNARQVVKPITDLAKSKYTVLPLSGFRRRWTTGGRTLTPITIGRFRGGVTFKVDTSKKRSALFVVQQKNAVASIFDMAGRRNSNQLDRSLQAAGWGTASRVMWPAAEARLTDVQTALASLIDDAAKTVQQGMPK
jgi:hypothetical protein